MRTTKELLQVLLKNMKKLDCGLCVLAAQLYDENIINAEEFSFLDEYIHDNKPLSIRNNAYWWKPGLKKPRIEWLREHIKINS